MKRTLHNLKVFGLASLLGMTAALPAHADDTEIYTGLGPTATAIDPNIMFIIDTSGSMGAQVRSIVAPYNPGTTYSGSCDNNRVYFSFNGQAPTCNTSAYFNKSRFRCAAANVPMYGTGSTSTGFYQDRIARLASGGFFFSSKRWRGLSSFAPNPDHVECRADENVHGADNFDAPANSTARYIIDSGSGYTTSFNNRKRWSSTGSFVTLYSANYLNYFNDSTNVTNSTRIQIVKDVVNSIIDSNSNLNISLMRFDTNTFNKPGGGLNLGGPIVFPFSDIDAANVRTNFKAAVNALPATGNTPLAETMFEASRIYRGETALAGNGSTNNVLSVTSAFVGNNRNNVYDTPLDVQCQKNFIIYLTDGAPTSDFEFDTQINSLISGSALPSGDTSCGGGDNCLDELAEYLNEVDQIAGLDGKQNIVTYTIGFFSNQTLLSNAATKGGGTYYLADNYAGLSDAFTQIITEIQAVNTTFTAPAVSVNAFNRVTNRNELFFTLFKPETDPLWTGNLKRYELDFLLDASGDPVDNDNDGVADPPQILDQNGALAVDPQTGFFDINSTSFWTQPADAPDGDATEKGGAARVLGGTSAALTADDPANRVVYTFTGAGTTTLSIPENRVVSTNANITSAMVGLTGAAGEPTLAQLVSWRAGVDIKDEDADGSVVDARRQLADPLHTKPVLATYGQSATTPDITLFMATNDGSIHAFDIDDGTEVFTFIPPDQLQRSLEFFTNSGTGSKAYGLDGNITLFHRDLDNDGILDVSEGERYILIVGQRRGGTRYYALDVTDRDNPVYLWSIKGGNGGAIANTLNEDRYQYELAQTWGTARIGAVKIDGTVYNVLIYGGGYDSDQDTVTGARTPDDSGRAIYMVNVFTGSLVWWGGKPPGPGTCAVTAGRPTQPSTLPCLPIADMDYSIPADIRVIDLNGDGFTDRLYSVDVGGQLWRLDVDNDTTTVAGLVSAYKLADLQLDAANSSATAQNNRKFFYSPDVSLIVEEDQAPYLAVAMGSGNRASPLETTNQNRFYMIKDVNPFAPPSSTPAVIYGNTLVDATLNLSPDVSGADGWFIELANGTTTSNVGSFVGEKVLSESVTFAGQLLFTTFSPVSGTSAGSCAPNQGTGRTFVINIANGAPVQDLDTVSSSTTLTRSDRTLDLVRTGIAPEVTILFPPLEGVEPVGLVAAEQLSLDFNNPPVRTFWYEQEQD